MIKLNLEQQRSTSKKSGHVRVRHNLALTGNLSLTTLGYLLPHGDTGKGIYATI